MRRHIFPQQTPTISLAVYPDSAHHKMVNVRAKWPHSTPPSKKWSFAFYDCQTKQWIQMWYNEQRSLNDFPVFAALGVNNCIGSCACYTVLLMIQEFRLIGYDFCFISTKQKEVNGHFYKFTRQLLLTTVWLNSSWAEICVITLLKKWV